MELIQRGVTTWKPSNWLLTRHYLLYSFLRSVAWQGADGTKLLWLMENNRYFCDISLDHAALVQLPENGE